MLANTQSPVFVDSQQTDSCLIDSHGRRISRLRLSLTERCNFRCLYCMPPEGVPLHPKSHYLSQNEIFHLAKIFTEMGVDKIRLTGGEPLLRDDLVEIVSLLRPLPHLKSLAITTNASRLSALARPLRDAGIDRINVSLDSLNAHTFAQICKTQSFEDVINGLRAVIKLGIPVKLNAVLLKGINDGEVFDFIRFASDEGVEEMRFIEFMPLCGTGWKPDLVLPLPEIEKKIAANYQLHPILEETDSVAETFEIAQDRIHTRVGFIRTISKPFCGRCSRIRLSATGFLQPCLFSHQGVDLKPSYQDENLTKQKIRSAIFRKNKENLFAQSHREQQAFNEQIYKSALAIQSQFPSIRAIGG